MIQDQTEFYSFDQDLISLDSIPIDIIYFLYFCYPRYIIVLVIPSNLFNMNLITLIYFKEKSLN